MSRKARLVRALVDMITQGCSAATWQEIAERANVHVSWVGAADGSPLRRAVRKAAEAQAKLRIVPVATHFFTRGREDIHDEHDIRRFIVAGHGNLEVGIAVDDGSDPFISLLSEVHQKGRVGSGAGKVRVISEEVAEDTKAGRKSENRALSVLDVGVEYGTPYGIEKREVVMGQKRELYGAEQRELRGMIEWYNDHHHTP